MPGDDDTRDATPSEPSDLRLARCAGRALSARFTLILIVIPAVLA